MSKWVVRLLILLLPGVLGAEGASGSRPLITGISHVTFYADDVAKSRQFYTELLGWEPVPASGDQPGLRVYANHLQYVELDQPPGPGLDHRLELVAFATSDAEALRRYLAGKGLDVPAVITKGADGARSFLTRDPEGNKVEFTQAGAFGPAAPARVAARLSAHILHAGYQVHDRAAMDHFYHDLLGFHLYWQGGAKPGDVDWVMMQVPDGTDYVEYMLNLPEHPSRAQLGGADHLAPGVASVAQLQTKLEQRGWKSPGGNPQVMGVDGKWQLDLRDPDGTRIEFMEFQPAKAPCCSAYTGRQPTPTSAW